jgi:prolyl 4-hydroxylase
MFFGAADADSAASPSPAAARKRTAAFYLGALVVAVVLSLVVLVAFAVTHPALTRSAFDAGLSLARPSGRRSGQAISPLVKGDSAKAKGGGGGDGDDGRAQAQAFVMGDIEKTHHVPWLPTFRGTKFGVERVRLPTTGEMREVSWRVVSDKDPRVLIINGTITAAEASELITAATPALERSRVIAGTHGENAADSIRTSTGMFMVSPEQWDMPANRNLRAVIAAMGGVPQDNWIEATQILRYEGGQRYVSHPDYYSRNDFVNLARGGQRIYTALTWLNEVPLGGTTSFPSASLHIKPLPFHSVLFYNVWENGEPDFHSMHGGDPPGKGCVKYVAVTWVHARTFV